MSKKKSVIIFQKGCLVLFGIVAVIMIILVVFSSRGSEDDNEKNGRDIHAESNNSVMAETESSAVFQEMEDICFDLGNNLAVTKVGRYVGAYMEDGSNEVLTDVMMIMVKNNGESVLQYAEITLSGEAGSAFFKLSTLNPGQTVVVLEAERKAYSGGDCYTEASAQNVVFFTEELTTYEDILTVQPLEGGFNIINISNKDITGAIIVYYKNIVGDMLYGGITYRGRIEDGLKSGEIKQIMTDNFSVSGTVVMFITISEE